jgi:hypothetical protein
MGLPRCHRHHGHILFCSAGATVLQGPRVESHNLHRQPLVPDIAVSQPAVGPEPTREHMALPAGEGHKDRSVSRSRGWGRGRGGLVAHKHTMPTAHGNAGEDRREEGIEDLQPGGVQLVLPWGTGLGLPGEGSGEVAT